MLILTSLFSKGVKAISPSCIKVGQIVNCEFSIRVLEFSREGAVYLILRAVTIMGDAPTVEVSISVHDGKELRTEARIPHPGYAAATRAAACDLQEAQTLVE